MVSTYGIVYYHYYVNIVWKAFENPHLLPMFQSSWRALAHRDTIIPPRLVIALQGI